VVRVGFIVSNANNSWVGGTIYLSNLLHAIHSLPNHKIQPVLIVGPSTPDGLLAMFPPVETIRTRLVEKGNKLDFVRKAVREILRRDYLLERFLKSHNIAALSHSGHLGLRAHLPTIQWIPDFQHRRLPEFFEAKELIQRDRILSFACKSASLVILSSFDAQRDLADFNPSAVAQSRVLHFVAGFAAAKNSADSLEDLRKRFSFDGPYFHLPNQFWAHKNHRLVIDTLVLLKARGRRVLVLATGHTRDYRQPDYFGKFKRKLAELEVEDSFRILGLVPYGDLAALMRHSVAVINPSLFEGWSTTVEEAKSMGKSILLSDIPVHREQAPEWGAYFGPNSPVELADAIEQVLNTYSPDVDAQRQAQAQEQLSERARDFARTYEKIVLEVRSEDRL
jgi:glycosyltransferase involved in cell wall biosynthesis